MPDPLKIYNSLLKLYPARFREEYQGPMEHQFRDEYRECHTARQRARLWVHAAADLASSAPAELLREVTRDLKHGLRVYRGRSITAVLAVAALGLALGTSTGIFSVLNALLIRSLPFSHPEELAELWSPPVGALNGRSAFLDWRSRSSYLSGAATFSVSEMNLSGGRDALRVNVAETSANFFALLGTRPVLGRTFEPAEDIPGRGGVAVISYALWQQMFGGNPSVTGTTLRVNGTPLTVIGVAPARFDYPGDTSIWLPSVFDFEIVPKRGAFFFETIGRLKPGIRMAQAREMFEAEVRRTAPERARDEGPSRARLTSLRDQLAGPVRQAGWVLSGMILLVLLAACANVAHLLLSRTTERRQELALRAALGASRARLLQQLITEATALTMAGSVLGLPVAHWAASAAASVAPAQLATQEYSVLDWRVLGFATLLALATGVVFGVLPAWLAGRLQPSGQALRTQAGTQESGTRRLRASLVALQAGLTVILLASSVAMGRAFLKLLSVDLGFRPANAVTLTVSLQGTRHQGGVAERQYYEEALQRLRAVPGVEAAGGVSYLPLAKNSYMATAVKLDTGQNVEQIVINAATPGFFRAIGTPVIVGREFAPRDGQGAEPAVVVNEAFAQRTGLGTAALGHRFQTAFSKNPYLIVGIVRTARSAGPAYPGWPQVYWPVGEEPPAALTLVARVRGEARALLATCRDAVRAVDREVPVYNVKTLDQRLVDALAPPKFYTTATLLLAALSVLLAGAGVYGTAVYSVANRKHEMGVRMALGASGGRIRVMMLRESLVPLGLGITAGVCGAIASGRYLEHLMVNAKPASIWACVTAAGLLMATGIAAVWSATAGVLAIDPADAVRAE